jgi:hypothetical protein
MTEFLIGERVMVLGEKAGTILDIRRHSGTRLQHCVFVAVDSLHTASDRAAFLYPYVPHSLKRLGLVPAETCR